MRDASTRRISARALVGVLAFGACSGGHTGEQRPAPASEVAAPASAALPPPRPPMRVIGEQVLAEAKSPFSTIRVRQHGKLRSLGFVRARGDEFLQTTIDVTDPDAPANVYIETLAAPLLAVDEPGRLLVIGLGGGNLVRMLHARLPAAQIDAVELDPEVVRLAAEWFGVVPGPRLRVFTADAVKFVEQEEGSYDVVWVDAFLDPGAPATDTAGVPDALRGAEFLQKLRARLRPGGVAAFNIHYLTGYREHVDAIASVFPRVYVARSERSNELGVLALERDAPLTEEAMRARAAILDALGGWTFSFAALARSTTPWRPD